MWGRALRPTCARRAWSLRQTGRASSSRPRPAPRGSPCRWLERSTSATRSWLPAPQSPSASHCRTSPGDSREHRRSLVDWSAYEADDGFSVYVDYAHTPDSVAKAARAVRSVTDGRLIVVLGAGGDRDPDKRPLMGQAAAEIADHVIITSDNPRSEDPVGIILADRGWPARGLCLLLDRGRPPDRDRRGHRPGGSWRRRPHRREGS